MRKIAVKILKGVTGLIMVIAFFSLAEVITEAVADGKPLDVSQMFISMAISAISGSIYVSCKEP